MKRVLLTGATGLIGRHCLPTLLAQGYEVHTVSTRAASTHPPGAHAHQADLLDPAQVAALLTSLQPSTCCICLVYAATRVLDIAGEYSLGSSQPGFAAGVCGARWTAGGDGGKLR